MDEKMKALIEGLNEDLSHEYAASIMYTYNAAVVTGLYRSVLKPFFESEVADEQAMPSIWLKNQHTGRNAYDDSGRSKTVEGCPADARRSERGRTPDDSTV